MSAFIDQVRDHCGVEPVCRTLGVSPSAYYQRVTGQRSERSVRHERLAARIGEVHEANYRCDGRPLSDDPADRSPRDSHQLSDCVFDVLTPSHAT